jgi:hypothetical protein
MRSDRPISATAFTSPSAGNPVRGTGKGGGTHPQVLTGGRAGMPMTLSMSAKVFTIFEGTSEIQRMLIGCSSL